MENSPIMSFKVSFCPELGMTFDRTMNIHNDWWSLTKWPCSELILHLILWGFFTLIIPWNLLSSIDKNVLKTVWITLKRNQNQYFMTQTTTKSHEICEKRTLASWESVALSCLSILDSPSGSSPGEEKTHIKSSHCEEKTHIKSSHDGKKKHSNHFLQD